VHTGFVIVDDRDNVATALAPLSKGVLIAYGREDAPRSVALHDDIPFGHKFALVSIDAGGDIIKYGETVGRATCPILAGGHGHVHNVEGLRGRGDRV
jgi:altronate dehydratase small subunit